MEDQPSLFLPEPPCCLFDGPQPHPSPPIGPQLRCWHHSQYSSIITTTSIPQRVTLLVRTHYNLPFSTFMTIHGLSPYLSAPLHISTPARCLRSSASIRLSVPSDHLGTMGSGAFSCSAPQLWSSLAPDLQNIKSILIFTFQTQQQQARTGKLICCSVKG